jgi:hypothetical protein
MGVVYKAEDVSLHRFVALGEEDVRGLDIAVDNTRRMRGIQSIGDFDAKRDRGFRVQWLSRDPRLQGHAIQEFHDDEGLTVLLPDLMDGANVGVVQSGSRLRLSLKASQGLRVLCDIIGQEFQPSEGMQSFWILDWRKFYPSSATWETLARPQSSASKMRSKSNGTSPNQQMRGRKIKIRELFVRILATKYLN